MLFFFYLHPFTIIYFFIPSIHTLPPFPKKPPSLILSLHAFPTKYLTIYQIIILKKLYILLQSVFLLLLCTLIDTVEMSCISFLLLLQQIFINLVNENNKKYFLTVLEICSPKWVSLGLNQGVSGTVFLLQFKGENTCPCPSWPPGATWFPFLLKGLWSLSHTASLSH